MNKNGRKSGYALSVLLVALIVVSIGIAAAIPMFSKKSDVFTNVSSYVQKCIEVENATDLNSFACKGALAGISKGNEKDYETLISFIYQKPEFIKPSLKLAKSICDTGVPRACDIFINLCVQDASKCDRTADGINSLYEYITIPTATTTNAGKEYIVSAGRNLYIERVPSFSDFITTACNQDMLRSACNICGDLKTMTYKFLPAMQSKYKLTGDVYFSSDAKMTLPNIQGTWLRLSEKGSLNAMALSPEGDYAYMTGQANQYIDATHKLQISVLKVYTGDGSTNNSNYPGWKKYYGTGLYFTDTITIGSGFNSYPVDIKVGDDKGLTIATDGSYVYVAGVAKLSGLAKMFVMKLDASNGNSVWTKYYTTAASSASSMIVKNDFIYVTGLGAAADTGFVMKLNTDGTSVWTKQYTGTCKSLDVSSDNYVYVGGTHTTSPGKLFLMKLDASNGNCIWKNKYGTTLSDTVSQVKLGPDENYVYMAGKGYSVRNSSSEFGDIYVLKLNVNDGTKTRYPYALMGKSDPGTTIDSGGWAVGYKKLNKSPSNQILDFSEDGAFFYLQGTGAVAKFATSDASYAGHFDFNESTSGPAIASKGQYVYSTLMTTKYCLNSSGSCLKTPVAQRINIDTIKDNYTHRLQAPWGDLADTAPFPWAENGTALAVDDGIALTADDDWTVDGITPTVSDGWTYDAAEHTGSDYWNTNNNLSTDYTYGEMFDKWFFVTITNTPVKEGYIETTSLSNIKEIVGGIKSITYSGKILTHINNSLTLASFDGRQTWKKYNTEVPAVWICDEYESSYNSSNCSPSESCCITKHIVTAAIPAGWKDVATEDNINTYMNMAGLNKSAIDSKFNNIASSEYFLKDYTMGINGAGSGTFDYLIYSSSYNPIFTPAVSSVSVQYYRKR